MVKTRGGRKSAGALVNSINSTIKDVNKSLQNPENLLILVLSLVLLALLVYYLKLQNDGSTKQEDYENYY